MKKIALLGILTTSVLCAELRVDVANVRVYSLPKSKHINQDEYHMLFTEIGSGLKPYGILTAPDKEICVCYSMLKMIGTPTAHRLISDIKQARKEYQANIR